MKIDNNLNLLKVLACFAVVILHISFICVENMKQINISYILYYASTFAVPVFFMVNGALILKKREITYKYIKKKINNILKVVVIWNVIIIILKFIVNHNIQNPIKVILNSLIQKGFFFQFWFFGALIIIYSTLPILKKVIKDNNFTKVFLMILIITVLIDVINMGRGVNGSEIVKDIVPQSFRLWTWYLYFILGHLLYVNKDYINKRISFKTNTILLIIFTIISIVYEIYMSRKILSFNAENYYDNILIILQIAIFFVWGLRVNLKKNTVYIINLISPCMIGIYIFHIPIMNGLKVYNSNNVILNTVLIFIVFLISTIISLFISKTKYIDKTITLK